MALEYINNLILKDAKSLFLECCHATVWANSLSARRPFHSFSELIDNSNEIFNNLEKDDWLEAFQAHPKIGDVKTFMEKIDPIKSFSQNEQHGISSATPDQLLELYELNGMYQKRHGFIFIICATGKTVDDFLCSIKERLSNSTETELTNAINEQRQITILRLKDLCNRIEKQNAPLSSL